MDVVFIFRFFFLNLKYVVDGVGQKSHDTMRQQKELLQGFRAS